MSRDEIHHWYTLVLSLLVSLALCMAADSLDGVVFFLCGIGATLLVWMFRIVFLWGCRSRRERT